MDKADVDVISTHRNSSHKKQEGSGLKGSGMGVADCLRMDSLVGDDHLLPSNWVMLSLEGSFTGDTEKL